jgi:hypothetical protein
MPVKERPKFAERSTERKKMKGRLPTRAKAL